MRHVKKERLPSRGFEVIILKSETVVATLDGNGNQIMYPIGWFVRNRETMADTEQSGNWEDYTRLKRVWRKSKEDFESACRFMTFGDLFSVAGIKL